MAIVKTRPYLITREGNDYLVEAANPGAALAHVTKDLISRCDAANGKQVSDFYRAGGTLQVAGQAPASSVPAPVVEAMRNGDDIDHAVQAELARGSMSVKDATAMILSPAAVDPESAMNWETRGIAGLPKPTFALMKGHSLDGGLFDNGVQIGWTVTTGDSDWPVDMNGQFFPGLPSPVRLQGVDTPGTMPAADDQ